MTDVATIGPSSDSLIIQTNGNIGLKAGTAAAIPLGWGVLNYTYLTDDQSLTASVGDQGIYDQTGTYLYTHCDTSFTVGAYCRIGNGAFTVGSFTRSGSTFTYTPFSGGTFTFTGAPFFGGFQGTRVEFRNVGTTWKVFYQGTEKLSVVASSVTFSSGRRTAALSMERKTAPANFIGAYPAGDYDSIRVAGITMNDLVVPANVGSGAKIVNTGTTASDGTGTSRSLFPASFFSTTEAATADITVTSSSNRFTVTEKGWYTITLQHYNQIPANEAPDAMFQHLLYKNGSAYQAGCERRTTFDGTDSVWAHALQSTWSNVYLVSGDYVQPGYRADSNLTSLFAGTGDAVDNYFSIGLTTKNLR